MMVSCQQGNEPKCPIKGKQFFFPSESLFVSEEQFYSMRLAQNQKLTLLSEQFWICRLLKMKLTSRDNTDGKENSPFLAEELFSYF